VNGRIAPLSRKLKNGDTVEILTSKLERGPSLDWLNTNLGYANTANARQKIRLWFRKQERSANIQRGKELLTKELHRLSVKMDERDVGALFKYDTAQEFLAALGSGFVSIPQVTSRLAAQQDQSPVEQAAAPVLTWPSSGIEVLGVGDLLTRTARCCNPVPGDTIIGYITRVRGITVHRSNCPNVINEDEKERLVEVSWGPSEDLHPVRVEITGWDRVGLLRDITIMVAGEKVNIAGVVTAEPGDGTAVITLTLYTTGVSQLSRLFTRLDGIKGVINVTRTTADTAGTKA
jgi:GTP pyrophosphokinase